MAIPLTPPQTSPRPMPRPAGDPRLITGEPVRGKSDNFMQQLMSNPATQAFLMQAFTSMLGQQGIAGSIGQGAAAMGRFAGMNADATRAREAEGERRKQQAIAQAAAAAGRGGGGGGGSGGMDRKEFMKIYKDAFDTLVDLNETRDVQWTLEELQGMATIEALKWSGESAPASMYNQLSDEDKAGFAREFAAGPTAGMTFLQDYFKHQDDLANRAATPIPEAPSDPAAPVSPAGPSGTMGRIGGPGVPEIATPAMPAMPTASAMPAMPGTTPQVPGLDPGKMARAMATGLTREYIIANPAILNDF